jgi:hypothetical protein
VVTGKKLTVAIDLGPSPQFYVNSGGSINVSTGSSNTDWWNNLKSAINTYTPFSGSTFVVDIPNDIFSEGTYLTSQDNSNSISGSFRTQYFIENNVNSSFSFASWLHVSSSISQDGTVLWLSSSDGVGTSREIVYDQGAKEIQYKVHFEAQPSGDFVRRWTYPISSSGVYDLHDQWFHFAVTHTASSAYQGLTGSNDVEFYINGANVSTTVGFTSAYTPNGLETINRAATNFSIFNKTTALSNEFLGGIDEVAMWNKELTSTNINDLFNNYAFISASQIEGSYLKAWYRMGEGDDANSTIKDQIDTPLQDLTIRLK